jgi:nitroreductase
MTTTGSLSVHVFRDAVEAAIRAPSMHNVQPWRFRRADDHLEVRLDPARQLAGGDQPGWDARIACGAAITNIWLALSHAGLKPAVAILPDMADPALIARVGVDGEQTVSPHVDHLYPAIWRRHSNRRPYLASDVPADARHRMQDAARRMGGRLEFVTEPQSVAAVADIIRAADQALAADPRYAAEVRRWSGREPGDSAGVARPAAGPEPEIHDVLAMRDFGGRPRATGRDFEPRPALAILSTDGSGPHDDVRAGRALQEVLLSATVDGLATSMLSQPMEVAAQRLRLSRLLSRWGSAQMIIRIGYGQPTPASGRRPLQDVIDD